ncbi:MULTISPECIES: hypothetical protein [unclassified Devosia]|nr:MULTISPECIES: hypothetical protein [unclassified Devosia]MBJ6987226.1 hypothetical protein [Devosia sp. MC521]
MAFQNIKAALVAPLFALLAVSPNSAEELPVVFQFTDHHERLSLEPNGTSAEFVTILAGDAVYNMGCAGNFCRVVHLRTRLTGYVLNDLRVWPVRHSVPNQPTAGVATAHTDLNVRMLPTSLAPKVYLMPKGTRFELGDCMDDYCFSTTADGLQGWVAMVGFTRDRVIARPLVNPDILTAPLVKRPGS